MPSRTAWADAYYRQARSDWRLFEELRVRKDVERAHALHYLQMATEKLAKAYRFRDTRTKEEDLLSSHVGFERFLRLFLGSADVVRRYAGRNAQLLRVRRECCHVARAVETLTPSVDPEASPVNAEYPWADGERVVAPVDHTFSQVDFSKLPGGRLFLTVVSAAFEEYGGRS